MWIQTGRSSNETRYLERKVMKVLLGFLLASVVFMGVWMSYIMFCPHYKEKHTIERETTRELIILIPNAKAPPRSFPKPQIPQRPAPFFKE
jgi:hypothetical protein